MKAWKMPTLELLHTIDVSTVVLGENFLLDTGCTSWSQSYQNTSYTPSLMNTIINLKSYLIGISPGHQFWQSGDSVSHTNWCQGLDYVNATLAVATGTEEKCWTPLYGAVEHHFICERQRPPPSLCGSPIDTLHWARIDAREESNVYR